MRAQLQREGYFTAPQAIDPHQVAWLREMLEQRCQTTKANMYAAEFLAIPELATIPFQPSVVSALKAALGPDYVTIPDYCVQTDQFGGWHNDSNNQGSRADYVFRPGWMQIQLGIYLQDNHPEYGGGLDVRPRGHMEILTLGAVRNPVRRALRLASSKLRPAISVPTKAGDLLGFHFRLYHRATQQTKPRRKFAIFWTAAAAGPDVERYMAHLRAYAANVQTFIPPQDYPDAARALIERQGLNVAV